MADLCVESSPDECLYCLYGGIPDGEEPPFPICPKHIDIVRFILDKADISNWIEFEDE